MRTQVLFASLLFALLLAQTAIAQQNSVLEATGPFRLWVATTDGFLNERSDWQDLPIEYPFVVSNGVISINGFAEAELDRHVLVFRVNASTNNANATELLVHLEGPLEMEGVRRPRIPFRVTVMPPRIGEFTFTLMTDSNSAGYTSSFLQVGVVPLEQFSVRAGFDDALPRTMLVPSLHGDTIRINASSFLARFPMEANSSDHFEATAWLSTKEPLFVPEPSRKALHAGSLIGLALLALATRRRRQS